MMRFFAIPIVGLFLACVALYVPRGPRWRRLRIAVVATLLVATVVVEVLAFELGSHLPNFDGYELHIVVH